MILDFGSGHQVTQHTSTIRMCRLAFFAAGAPNLTPWLSKIKPGEEPAQLRNHGGGQAVSHWGVSAGAVQQHLDGTFRCGVFPEESAAVGPRRMAFYPGRVLVP